MDKLLQLMVQLRDPESGCAWDVLQTSRSIVPYTIEEAYEVADAIERGDMEDLRDELGDLLLQVVFHARIAEEAGHFCFNDVVEAIIAKLIRRHPHVFDPTGKPIPAASNGIGLAAIDANWTRIKAQERLEKERRATADGRTTSTKTGPLDGIPLALPALTRAEKISRKAAGYGFDWPNAREVIAKVREETEEVEQSLAEDDPRAVVEEIGDLLFSVANVARHAGIDPEDALRQGTRKFERRFTAMAAELADRSCGLAHGDLAAMEVAWQAVKRAETSPTADDPADSSQRIRSKSDPR